MMILGFISIIASIAFLVWSETRNEKPSQDYLDLYNLPQVSKGRHAVRGPNGRFAKRGAI